MLARVLRARAATEPARPSRLSLTGRLCSEQRAVEHSSRLFVLRLELPVELTLAVVEVDFAALNPCMCEAVGAHVEGVAFRQEQRGRLAALPMAVPTWSSMPRIRAGLRVNAWMACSSVRPYARAVPAKNGRFREFISVMRLSTWRATVRPSSINSLGSLKGKSTSSSAKRGRLCTLWSMTATSFSRKRSATR